MVAGSDLGLIPPRRELVQDAGRQRRNGTCRISTVMESREKMNVGLGRTSLVVAASDGPSG